MSADKRIDVGHGDHFRGLMKKIKGMNPILDVALELGGIDRTCISGDEYRGPCPTGHDSAGGKCCHFDGKLGLYHCFSCNVGGDVIKLVQLKKFGAVSSETWWPALELLARRAGLVLPGRSDQDAREEKHNYDEHQRAKAVLTRSAVILNSLLTQAHRLFLRDRYGFSNATIDKFMIGYAEPGKLTEHLRGCGVSDEDLLLSGLYRLGPAGPEERFVHRLMFPYFLHGEVVYFIGRKTERTPAVDWEAGKYKKLKTYGPNATYIAKRLENKVLFNQQEALGAKSVVVTEGVADCISLSQNGFAAISPVTVRFSRHDQENVLKVLRKGQTVFVANDNDTNAAGEQGALAMAQHLARNGFTVKLIEIPLLEKHHAARRQLAALESRA